jgi:hypothetical protein
MTLKEKLPIFLINTFTPHPSLSPYSQTEIRRNKYTHYAWAGGTFFPVVLLCQFSVLVGNRFGFYILLMYLEYHTVEVVIGYSWLDGLLRNPWSGVHTPQVLGYSGLRD